MKNKKERVGAHSTAATRAASNSRAQSPSYSSSSLERLTSARQRASHGCALHPYSDQHIAALAQQAGRHNLGGGLTLVVKDYGRPRYVFRYSIAGKRRELPLGRWPSISIFEARAAAEAARERVEDGADPWADQKAERRRQRAEVASQGRVARTLRLAASELHALQRPQWRNEKHAQQWLRSLDHLGLLMDEPLDAISPARLLAILEPLNLTKHETAKRVRQRVEAIFDREILLGHAKQNPAGLLRRALRAPARKNHHAMLAFAEVPAFIQQLRDGDAGQAVRLGFEWLILSASRTGEVIRARWGEIDSARQIWTIQGERMKTGNEHRVPLTDRHRTILAALERPGQGDDDWLFASPDRAGQPLSDAAFAMVVHRCGLKGKATPHGFRASFSTWANETGASSPDVIEAALAHVQRDQVRAAYNRADYWAARVTLAQQWADYICGAISTGKKL